MFPGTKGNVTITASSKANPLNNLVDMLEEAQTDDEGNNITASNITLLSEYLLNLEPQAAKDIVISNASFESADITFEMEEDGTYTAKADVHINATINEDDELKLTIKYGELSHTVALTAGGGEEPGNCFYQDRGLLYAYGCIYACILLYPALRWEDYYHIFI